MKSSQKNIYDVVKQMLASGQGLSLLQKMGMEISINNWNELDNYIFILLILIEQPNYYAEASELILKRVLLNIEFYQFLGSNKEKVYEELFNNRVLPYVGLSGLIRRLLGTSIRKREDENDIISSLPSKSFLLQFNTKLLKDFLENQTDVTYATSLLYNCWADVLSDDKIILSSDAINVFREFLKKILSRLMNIYVFFSDFNGMEGQELGMKENL
jgi:hypothetical protein